MFLTWLRGFRSPKFSEPGFLGLVGWRDLWSGIVLVWKLSEPINRIVSFIVVVHILHFVACPDDCLISTLGEFYAAGRREN